MPRTSDMDTFRWGAAGRGRRHENYNTTTKFNAYIDMIILYI